MTYYLLVGENDIIYDAVVIPTEGYIEVEIPNENLPVGINAGCYYWLGGTYVLDAQLYEQIYGTGLDA